MPLVKFGRCSGASTDKDVESVFEPAEVAIVTDVLAMVNTATGGVEQWWYQVDSGPRTIPINCNVHDREDATDGKKT